jgi:starch synthase
LTGEVYGQDVTFIANDWHAALVPVFMNVKFRKYKVREPHTWPR